MAIWSQKVFYDSRYALLEEDVFHRLFQILVLLILATAVVHIRPVGYMSNSGEVNMFFFSLMLVLERVLAMFTYAEVYFFGVGERENLKHDSKTGILLWSVSTLFYVAALAVAAKEYYGEDDNHGRVLAASSETESTTNVPIWLILGGHIAFTVVMTVRVIFFFPAGGLHKKL
jgi:hypothetical protein